MEIKAKTDTHKVSEKSEVKIQHTEYSDGGYEEVRVEKVEGGYIKTVCKHFKDGDEWQWTDVKSVSLTDPLDESSLADKLKAVMQGD